MITLIMRVASPHNARDRAVITTAAISKHEAHIDGGGTFPVRRCVLGEWWEGCKGRGTRSEYHKRARKTPRTLVSRTQGGVSNTNSILGVRGRYLARPFLECEV
jgi:hypothetical protein